MGRQRRIYKSPDQASAELADPADPGGQAPDPAVVARNLMLRKLTAAARTRSELADLLAERGIPDDVAEVALERFVEVGLIDDAAFANNFVASRSGGRGRTALRVELRRRGIDDQTAEAALAEVLPAAERAAAERLVAKRLPSLAGLDGPTRTRRLVGMLGRRGFAPSLALEIVRTMGTHTEADDSDPA